jgi:Short C-terminal domain
MFVRRRPLLRAAVVGGGAYVAGKRRAQYQADQQYANDQQDARINDLEQSQGGQNAPPPSQQTGAPSIPDQLSQLNALHDQGALSDAEFAAAKQRLLGS